MFTLSLLLCASVALPVSGLPFDSSLTVRTHTGTYTGLQEPDYPDVRAFRNIPYAQPPVGRLRFQSPQKLPRSRQHHYSHSYPPSCPQSVSSRKTFFNQVAPFLMIDNALQNHSSGLTAQTSAEDCLSLAIWTPRNMTAGAHLPVAFFMTGGAFQTGGIDIPGQIPAAWVNRTQEHIVVTINYRVNMFGFPNAAGSSSANVGILDQRMALEWVAHNIASFGGDPKRILLWGQSAGAQSVDYHNYAFWNDPISHASFSESGTALKSTTSQDHGKTNFTFVAKSLGCDFASNPQAEMECMQRLPFQLIEDFLGDYNGADALTFGPVADEVLIFSNYTERATTGYISPSPAIFSDAANNDVALLPWPAKNETAVIEGTLKDWVCPTAQTSILRQQAGRITYRAQYAGNFSNETPYPYLGAYHCADLMMYFGTYGLNATNATTGVTRLERETSEAMQDRLLAFAKDPVNGLVRFEWERYEEGGKAVRFGADRRAVQEINVDEIDDACFGNGTYNAYP